MIKVCTSKATQMQQEAIQVLTSVTMFPTFLNVLS